MSPPASTDAAPATPWRSLLPIFLYFAATGIVTVMLGPLLPSFIQRWHLEDAQAGTLFSSFFAGQFLGSWFATRNLRFSLLAGAALAAAGCTALHWTTFHTAHLALATCGLGLGLSLAAGNVVAGTSSANRARVLAILNVSWSLGAIACPALLHAAGSSFFAIAGAILALSGLCIAITGLPSAASAPDAAASPSRLPLSLLTMLLFAASLLLYIGTENSLGGWLPSFALRNSTVLSSAAIALSYWLAELMGRLLLAALPPHLSPSKLYRAFLTLLLLVQATLLLTPHPANTLIVAAVILSGVALGPLYPLLVSLLLARTGQHPRLGALFACASLGGAILPWLTGAASTRFSTLRAGLCIPLIGVLAMLLFSSATQQPASDTQKSSA
ncbi:MFS transporter [Edaphobacter flagellatus]|uniref:MFS transporter n=1 Tax=Edaphobacter flagellatus TaxID=1933044 RepID=UPI0021B41C2B|nr:MFS transporter [Edaphobacter flagellatus]